MMRTIALTIALVLLGSVAQAQTPEQELERIESETARALAELNAIADGFIGDLWVDEPITDGPIIGSAYHFYVDKYDCAHVYGDDDFPELLWLISCVIIEGPTRPKAVTQ